VASLYDHLLGRAADASGLAHWTDVFRSSNDKDALVRGFTSAGNYYQQFVLGEYARLLGQDSRNGGAPDAGEVAMWVERMRAGLPRRQLMAELCGGEDFWALSGRTNTGYVERLYRTLLRRDADPDGVSYWAGLLNSGMSREDVAARFLGGDDFHGTFVDEQYEALLDRATDEKGRAYWVGRMREGMSQEEVIRQLLEGREFWWGAVRAGYRERR
jgi:hypothetical protein